MDTRIHVHSSTMTDISKKNRKNLHLSRVLKFIIFTCCIGGFSYQATEFITHFYAFPTTISIELKTPEKYILPAFTFCNNNPAQRSKYCAKFPNRCERPQNMELFCDKLPHYCSLRSNMSDFVIPKLQYYSPDSEEDFLSLSDVVEFEQNVSNFLVSEFYSFQSELQQVLFEVKSNYAYYHLCYTKYLLFQNKEDPYFHHFNPQYSRDSPTVLSFFHFNVEEEEMFNPRSEPGILFSFYNPYVARNPFLRGMFLKTGKKYNFRIRLEKERLLPSPYETNCTDYEDLWLKNNRTGPRSQKMCRELCWMNFTMGSYGCFRSLDIITSNLINSMCNESVRRTLKTEYGTGRRNQLNTCRSKCKRDCVRLMYPYTVEVRSFEKETVYEEKRSAVIVELTINDPEILVRSHKPQYMDVEIFSYIGGFMGCWLGISIWTFSGMFSSLFRSVAEKFTSYKVLKKKPRGEIETREFT